MLVSKQKFGNTNTRKNAAFYQQHKIKWHSQSQAFGGSLSISIILPKLSHLMFLKKVRHWGLQGYLQASKTNHFTGGCCLLQIKLSSPPEQLFDIKESHIWCLHKYLLCTAQICVFMDCLLPSIPQYVPTWSLWAQGCNSSEVESTSPMEFNGTK